MIAAIQFPGEIDWAAGPANCPANKYAIKMKKMNQVGCR